MNSIKDITIAVNNRNTFLANYPKAIKAVIKNIQEEGIKVNQESFNSNDIEFGEFGFHIEKNSVYERCRGGDMSVEHISNTLIDIFMEKLENDNLF